MTVYIINFVLNMLLGLFLTHLKRHNDKRRPEKLYLIITAVQFGLLCGFRDTIMTYDSSSYVIIFDRVPNTWDTIFDNKMYISIGFSVFCSIIKILGGTYQTMFIISSLFIMGCACIFVYRHSRNIVLSVFVLISFPFYYSSYDLIRYYMAVSFFLLGYKYVKQKKFLHFMMFVLMGYLFHSTALLFTVFYFIGQLKWNWKTIIMSLFVSIVFAVSIHSVGDIVAKLIGNATMDDRIGDFNGGIKTAAMYVLILLIAVLAYYNQLQKYDKANTVFAFFILAVLSISFTYVNFVLRFMYVTIPIMAISLPELVCDRDNVISYKNNTIYLYAFLAIGVFYHMFMLISNWKNIVPYIPYWK